MATYIRLTDYKDSESKEQGFFKSENRYEAKQDDLKKSLEVLLLIGLVIKRYKILKKLQFRNHQIHVKEWRLPIIINLQDYGMKLTIITFLLMP